MKMKTHKIKSDLLLSQVKRGFEAYKKTIELCDFDIDYDIIFAHETFCSGLAGLYASEQLDNPYLILDIVEYPIFSQRSSMSVKNAGLQSDVSDKLTSLFAMNMLNCYDYAFATSPGQIETYQKLGAKTKIDLLRNCREKDKIIQTDPYLRKKFNFATDDIILLYSNRVYQDCGIELLLDALALLDSRFKVVVLGDVVPEMKEKVEILIKKNQVGDRFFVTGLLPPEQVLPLTKEADIALTLLEPVNENHKTALPNRLFDAVAAQVPVLVFNQTECSKFVRSYNIGDIVEELNPECFKKTILKTIKNINFLKNSVKKAAKIFCWENEELKLFEILQLNCPYAQKCLFIANKDIRRNDRIRRLLKSFSKLNIMTTIVTPYLPFKSMIVPDTKYFSWKE